MNMRPVYYVKVHINLCSKIVIPILTCWIQHLIEESLLIFLFKIPIIFHEGRWNSKNLLSRLYEEVTFFLNIGKM